MNVFLRRIIGEKWYIPVVIVLLPLLYLHIGLPPIPIVKDGFAYDAYAKNIIAGHGYTWDGVHFSDVREPAYPALLVFVYLFFGIGNVAAIANVQLLMIGITGALLYVLFKRLGYPVLGVLTGVSTALFPSYGLSAGTGIATEPLFTLLLTILFLVGARIIERKGEGIHLFLWIGIVAALAALTRVQVLFLPLFLLILYIVFLRPSWRKLLLNGGTALAAFIIAVGSWMVQVHAHTGVFAITEGRPEIALYLRAVRATLSYKEQSHYGYEWIVQSVTSGTKTDDFFYEYDYHKLQADYGKMATTAATVAALKKWTIGTILANPGHYLYGNLIELMKMSWIEHDYSETINRYLRAGVYVALYSLFLFAIYQFFRKGSWKLKSIMLLAFFFILYNWLVLTPFDVIPRYNIPYLQFFILIGFLGVALFQERRRLTTKK